jgi:4-methylaminobutanoate oxidase (formaldehyde-forming)
MRVQINRRYLHERTRESLGLLYGMHWPFRQVASARPVRQTALHDRLKSLGACFGETAGWERANWYKHGAVEPVYGYAWGRQNWFAPVGEEHRAVRERAGLFDLSSFAKFEVSGRDAEQALQHLCANNIGGPVGKINYTQMLDRRGGIQVDCTVTRLAEHRFWIVDAAANQVRTLTWLRRNIDPDARVHVHDITNAYSVLSLMGPKSRSILSGETPSDLSNAHFPFGTMQEIEPGLAVVNAFRVTYVGELGWELYIPVECTQTLFDLLWEVGVKHGLAMAGYHALDSLRLEKGYRHWGHDISPAETPYEAGLGFAVALDKPGGFMGRDAITHQKGTATKRRLVHVLMKDKEPFLYHDEPIRRDGKIIGRITSGSEGYTLGAAVGIGYVKHQDGATKEFVETGDYEIEIAGERFPARVSLRPFYDPISERIRM